MRMLTGSLLCAALVLAGGFGTKSVHANVQKRWAIVNFVDAVSVKGHVLMGRYLIVHDDERMAHGEPCTTIYRFDTKKGPQEEEVSFVCHPAQRAQCDKTTLSINYDAVTGLRTIDEYQFAGDTEGHGVPRK